MNFSSEKKSDVQHFWTTDVAKILTMSIILKIAQAVALALANASKLGAVCPTPKAPRDTEKKTKRELGIQV